MKQITAIFIGKSGCGKGTQMDLLMRLVGSKDPQTEIVSVQTGALFREYMEGNTYSSAISREITLSGGLQPEFIAINLWSNHLLASMKPNVHLFVDGMPRKFYDAGVFDSAIKFYRRDKPFVIYLDAPHTVVIDRLLKRGRVDDTQEGIKKRLGWFETDVLACIEFYKKHPDYRFLEINGDQTIEKVHADIVRALGV